MTEKPQNIGIHERLNEAKAAVKGYIKKDQEKQTGKNYASLSHDAVTAHCRQAMIDNGILVSPTEIAHLHEDTGMRTNAGNPIFRWEVTLDVRSSPPIIITMKAQTFTVSPSRRTLSTPATRRPAKRGATRSRRRCSKCCNWKPARMMNPASRLPTTAK